MTSGPSYAAMAYGADQVVSGGITLGEIYTGAYKKEDSFDNRMFRNGMITLFGKEGATVYDLGNIFVNVQGVMIINNAPKEVMKYFNEVARVNSAVTIHDSVISIKTNNNDDKKP